MKAVYEELNGDIAVFLVEELKRTVSINQSKLPADARIGDIYEVEWNADAQLQFLNKLPDERAHREESVRRKREMLLRRSRKKK